MTPQQVPLSIVKKRGVVSASNGNILAIGSDIDTVMASPARVAVYRDSAVPQQFTLTVVAMEVPTVGQCDH